MTEKGVVKSVENQIAVVSVKKKDECSKCGMCLFSKGADSIEFSCNNTVNAKAGDQVIIERSEKGKLLGVFLVFIVPLMLIGLALLVGYVLIKSELASLIASVLSIVLWYIILSFADKKLKTAKRFKNDITEIINKEN